MPAHRGGRAGTLGVRIVCTPSGCLPVFVGMMRFTHPLNQHEVKVRAPWFWMLLFGPLYLAAHDAWSQAFITLVVTVATAGLSWVIYPFFAGRIVRKAYLRKGWQPRTV